MHEHSFAHRATLGVSFAELSDFTAVPGLVIRDTSSLVFIPKFQRSEILVRGRIGIDLCRRTRLCRNAHAAIQSAGMNPRTDRHHRRLSNRLGVLRLVDCFAAGDRLEHDRSSDQFRERRGVPIFRP